MLNYNKRTSYKYHQKIFRENLIFYSQVTKCDRDEGYLVLYLSDEPRDIFLEQMKAITEIKKGHLNQSNWLEQIIENL